MSTTHIGLHVNLAEQFLESVSEDPSDNVYFTFGKVDAWSNEASPQSANTMPLTYYEVWRNMIGAKKISGNDISLAIRRRNWTANTVYDQWDHTNPNMYLSNVKFYVMTSDYNVYKCIYNNSQANSTIEPTSVNANNVSQTADGYIWKYMYTLTSSERLKFLTTEYMPIKKLSVDNNSLQWDVQQGATEGAIYAVNIASGGNYTNTSNISIAFSGDGEDAAANVTVNTVSNTVNSIVMTNYGTGYTRATASLSGGGGTGGASLVPLIGPQGGHGSEPIYELGASFIVINTRLETNENGKFSTDNEYRQVSLIKNPLEYGSTNTASNTVISQTMDITVAGSGVNYIEDEIVYQGTSIATATFSGKVLEYDSANSLVRAIDTVGSPTNDLLIGANSTAAKFITSVDNPEFQRFTGRLMYSENIQTISRDPDQTEDFKIIIGL